MIVLAALSHHVIEFCAGNASAVHHSDTKHHRSVKIFKKLHMSCPSHWNALVSCSYETVFSVLRDVQHS